MKYASVLVLLTLCIARLAIADIDIPFAEETQNNSGDPLPFTWEVEDGFTYFTWVGSGSSWSTNENWTIEGREDAFGDDDTRHYPGLFSYLKRKREEQQEALANGEEVLEPIIPAPGEHRLHAINLHSNIVIPATITDPDTNEVHSFVLSAGKLSVESSTVISYGDLGARASWYYDDEYSEKADILGYRSSRFDPTVWSTVPIGSPDKWKSDVDIGANSVADFTVAGYGNLSAIQGLSLGLNAGAEGTLTVMDNGQASLGNAHIGQEGTGRVEVSGKDLLMAMKLAWVVWRVESVALPSGIKMVLRQNMVRNLGPVTCILGVTKTENSRKGQA